MALRQVATGFLRSHPLPSGGAARVKRPPSGDRWLRRQVATALRSHPLPSGGSRDNNLHRLATGGYGDRWLRLFVAIRSQAVVAVRVKPPPSGDRWLRRQVATGFLRSHPLPSGGSRDNNLHRLATGGYQRQVATGFLRSHPLPSGGSRDNNLHRLATGGYQRQVATGDRWLPQAHRQWGLDRYIPSQRRMPKLHPMCTQDISCITR